MCELISAALLSTLGVGGAATATGAVATAATSAMSVGSILAIGGSLYQGVTAYKSAKANQRAITEQKQVEAAQNAVKDQRERAQFRSSMAKQASELAGRGVQLDSPTAVLLGQSAAQEMAFNSQSIRATGQSRQTELSAEYRAYGARANSSLLNGGLSAAGSWLNSAPKRWEALS